MFLGDDEVGRQRGFETAAERAALDEGDAGRLLAERARPLEEHVGTGQ